MTAVLDIRKNVEYFCPPRSFPRREAVSLWCHHENTAGLWLHDTLFVHFFTPPGDDPPACDRGEDEPESISALQSTIRGRRDSGWNWWVGFCQKPPRPPPPGPAFECCNKNEVKWKQWWNSHMCRTDIKLAHRIFFSTSVNLFSFFHPCFSSLCKREIQI